MLRRGRSRARLVAVLVPLISFPPGADAASAAEEVTVAIVLSGDAALLPRVREVLAGSMKLPVDVRFAELPSATADHASSGEIEGHLATSRRAYIDADFRRCLDEIAGDAVVPNLLATGRQSLAARVLLWRTACNLGAGDLEEARRLAHAFAVFGFDVPIDVEATTPEVEAILAEMLGEVAGAARIPLRVTSSIDRASVSIDGRREVCATPCVVDLPPGDHVVRLDADGMTPEFRVVRVAGDASEVAIEPSPAPPELCAQQWTSRYAGSVAIESSASVTLLACAIRAQRLILLTVEEGHESGRARGVLAVDGKVASRAERTIPSEGRVDTGVTKLLRELLVLGNVLEHVPLIKRPVFWVVVSAVALVTAAATTAIFYRPPRTTIVTF